MSEYADPVWRIYQQRADDHWLAAREDVPFGLKRYVNARGQLVDVDSSSRWHSSREEAEEAIALYVLRSQEAVE